MNVFFEPLPGLLDEFQIPDLPYLTDYHIAPLRDPAPRSLYAPSPLEPTTDSNVHARAPTAHRKQPIQAKRRTPKISPAEIILARDAKKPSIAISELIEARTEETQSLQLPSFVSLAIVERSPVQQSRSIDDYRPSKRVRLDFDVDTSTNEDYRHLPLPSQKEAKISSRTKPLLPAMVTGLHEPPPTAALLPSMETVKLSSQSPEKPSNLQLDLLSSKSVKRAQGRPPEQMLNSPEITTMPLAPMADPVAPRIEQDIASSEPKTVEPKSKKRRSPKWWTEDETEQLMLGVRKHGIGKWKQILADPNLHFDGRSCVDLKDRFRVRRPDAYRDRDLAKEDTSNTKPSPMHEYPKDSTQVSSTDGADSGQHTPHASPKLSDTLVIAAPVSRPNGVPSTAPEELGQCQAIASKTSRRKRRPWTITEDNDLMRGVQRHGFQWTLIHDDPMLNLSHRKATDLRDRIRNMFPDGYKNAGTRPKREQNEGGRALPPLMLDDDGDWDWSIGSKSLQSPHLIV